MMKKLAILIFCSLFITGLNSFGQTDDGGVSIGKGNLPANSKSILELVSQTKGLLIPRMTTGQRTAIFTAADQTAVGLMVYDTNLNSFFYWLGSEWKDMGSSANASGVLTVSIAPPTNVKGNEVYFDTDDNLFYKYDNGTNTWKALDFGGSSAGSGVNLPSAATAKVGSVFYHLVKQQFYVFDGENWIPLSTNGSTPSGTSLPATAKAGDVYFVNNTTEKRLYLFDGTQWTPVGSTTLADGSITEAKLQAAGAMPLTGGVNGQVLTSAGNNQFKWTNRGSVPGGATNPTGGAVGDVYYNTTDKNLYYYDGSSWILVSGTITGATNPATGTTGETFYNTATNTYYIYSNGIWNPVGGSTFVLQPASSTTLGGIKVGANLTIDANGFLSATGGGGSGITSVSHDASLTGSGISTDQLGIANNAVTYTKIQNASANSRLLGSSGTATTIGEITLGTGLSMSGSTLNATGSSVTGQTVTSTAGTITIGNGTGAALSAMTLDLADNAVTSAKLASGAVTSAMVTTALGFTPENSTNKVTSLSGSSTDSQYPSAKLVYDQLLLKADAAAVAGKADATNVVPYVGASGNVTLGTHDLSAGKIIASNLQITNAPSNGYVLKSDALGNASWQAATSSYKGTWDAGTNTPLIHDNDVNASAGDYYLVSVSGSFNGRSFTQGGQAVYNGNTKIWESIATPNAVSSVNGLTGIIQINPSLSGNTLSLTGGTQTVDISAATNVAAAYNERLRWDGGNTGLNAATGRTSLGATTVGGNLFSLINPGAISFLRINADNSVSALDATAFKAALSVGSGTGDVTSVGPFSVNSIALFNAADGKSIKAMSSTGTAGNLLVSGGSAAAPTWSTLTSLTTAAGILPVANGGTGVDASSTPANYVFVSPNGSAGVPTFRALVAGDIPALSYASMTHAHGNISNAGAIGSTSGLVVVTGTSGVLQTLAVGTTSQFLRGDGIWAAPTGTGDVSSSISSSTSGQLAYFNSTTGKSITALGLGTSTTVLHGNASGAPIWGAIALGTDVSGTLGILNGGTGATTAPAALTNLGAAPLASPTFTGKVTTAASAAGSAGFNLPQGAAPTIPANGDIWTTSSGVYAQINNATVQLSGGSSGVSSITGTANQITASAATGAVILSLPATINVNTSGTAANVSGVVAGANGGTGIANTGKTITLGGNFVTSGASSLTLTTTAATNVTLPTSGTLMTNPMSAVGDIIIGGAAGTPTKLGAGAANYVLTSNGAGTAPSWQAASGGSLPTGSAGGNTLRYNGTWLESNALTNDGTNVATSGKLTVGGTLQTAGAVYARVRVNTTDFTVWNDDDYIVILKKSGVQDIYLPNPGTPNSGRVLIIRNDSGNNGTASTYTFKGSYVPVNNTTLTASPAGKGMMLVSDGTSWFCVAGGS